jgi:hypothetical protein
MERAVGAEGGRNGAWTFQSTFGFGVGEMLSGLVICANGHLCHEGQRPAARKGLAFCREIVRHREALAPLQGALMGGGRLPGASPCSAPGCPLGPRWGRTGSVEARVVGEVWPSVVVGDARIR